MSGVSSPQLFGFYIHLPRVVIPRLDVGAANLGMGSVEWDSDTGDEIPGDQDQEGSPKKGAKVDTAAKEPEAGLAAYEPTPKPR